MPERDHDIDALALALYNVSALRRALQRLAGIEHAVGALSVLGVVQGSGPARISDVAATLELDLSVVSRRVHGLEDQGLVDRVADPHDGRSSLIAISAAGTAKLRAAHDRIVEALSGALADWDRGEVAALADGLVRLCEALGSHESQAAPGDRDVATQRTSKALRPTGTLQEEHSR